MILQNFEKNIPKLSKIVLPWKMFSSNKHIKQPDSVIKGFTDRKYYLKWESRSKKYIVNTNFLLKLDIHDCHTKNGEIIDSSGNKPKLYKDRQIINEAELEKQQMVLV